MVVGDWEVEISRTIDCSFVALFFIQRMTMALFSILNILKMWCIYEKKQSKSGRHAFSNNE